MRIRDEDFSLPPFPKLCSMHDGLRRRLKFEKNDHGLPKVATRNIIKNLLFLGLRERGDFNGHLNNPHFNFKSCPTPPKQALPNMCKKVRVGWLEGPRGHHTHTHLFPARCNARKRFFLCPFFFADWKRVEKRNIYGNSAARKSGKYGELSVFLLLLQRRRKWQILQKREGQKCGEILFK